VIALAIDVGGSHIRYGLVKRGVIIRTESFSVDPKAGMRALLPELKTRVMDMLVAAQLDHTTVGGIGLSFPAVVDSVAGTVKWVPRNKFEDSVTIDFRRWAQQSLRLPLAIENDANMALLGEWQFGAGVGCDDLVQVTLGTGVGTSAVIRGVPLRGKHFQAGCLGGFQIINFDGVTRLNGYHGYAECEASTWVLPELLAADPLFANSTLNSAPRLDFRTVFEHAQDHNDTLARQTVDRSAKVWAAVITNLIHAYDPERVILSGGLMKSADLILPRIRKEVESLAHTYWGDVDILVAQHIDDAALLGAWYAVDRDRL
jgi:glucokinase